MMRLCSSLYLSWIQLDRAMFQLIGVGFIHSVGLLGSLQPCNDELVYVLKFVASIMLGSYRG